MISSIELRDDGSAWVTVVTHRDEPTEPTGTRAEVAQVFGYTSRPRGLLRDITDQMRARKLALQLAEKLATRHPGATVTASWWVSDRGVA